MITPFPAASPLALTTAGRVQDFKYLIAGSISEVPYCAVGMLCRAKSLVKALLPSSRAHF